MDAAESAAKTTRFVIPRRTVITVILFLNVLAVLSLGVVHGRLKQIEKSIATLRATSAPAPSEDWRTEQDAFNQLQDEYKAFRDAALKVTTLPTINHVK